MANVPFPPLFCSTPPPIDDEPNMSPINDDEDFGDFADAYQENLGNYMENNTDDDFNAFHNAQFVAYVSNEPNKAPITKAEYDLTERNIPQTKLNSDYMNAPDIDSNENDNKSNSEENFNVQLTNNDTASFSSLSEHQSSSATSISPVSKSPSPRIEAELDGDDKDFGEFGQFDKSIEVAKSDSGRSTENDSVSQDANLKSRNAPDLSNIVVVEDLVDDSSDDERHSIRNRNNIYCDEASRDFFAIHAIEDNKVFENNMQNIPCESDGNDVHLEVQPVVAATDASTERLILAVETAASVIPDDSIQKDLTQLSSITLTKEFNVEEKGIQKYETVSITSDFERNDIKSSHNEAAISQDMDDDFANFQDFSSAPCTWQKTWPASAENSLNQTIEKPLNELPKSSETYSSIPADQVAKDKIDNSADDDDDFGDFTEAPVVATSHVPQSTQPTMPAAKYNLNEQLKSILKIMFPNVADSSETASIESNTPKPQTNNLTNSVESAKALEYQWSGSMVRHAFIKSLGIDSRNIFLTEKWNPAMPRFAANLSFDPLQPLKPTSVPLQPETVSGAANNSKSDVPVAEFDWKSSGLVNPLDGPQAEMVRQSIDASKAESSISDVVENESNSNADGSHTTTETSTVAASTTGGTLSSTLAGRGNIDSSDNNFDHNIDIGLYDVLSSKRATQLPKENVSIESNSLDLEENLKHSEDSKVLDTVGCATIESSIPLHMVYSVDDDAEVHIDNGVISRSTFAGPLKETHIFTPSKNMPDLYEKNMPTAARTVSPATTIAPKVFPIDFDYEKAAAGIIIDEKVVHKEYRDVEYNPGFGLEGSHTSHIESPIPKQLTTLPNTWNTSQQQEEEIDDDFSDFQSVPPPEPLRTATPRNDKLSTPTPVNGMILSPAILLPQAISIENKQPKIEWGNSAASIDPDELARIEQLFPQDNSSRNSSRKSTPTHTNSLSISASIANKTSQEQVVNNDDDDWSDFVSVPVPTPNRTFSHSPQKSKLETNNDEWSDFVSSVPNTQATVANLRITPAANSYGMPQFNSASWQNANFYNNPLSVYHRNQVNAVPNMTSTKFQNNNCSSYNNNNNTNNHHNNYSKSNNNLTQYLPNFQTTQQKLPQQQQKIQVMQDFSTSSSDFNLYRPNIPQSNYTGPTNSHFQVGSAKVAPTVSLIPDLGFVAPAMPVHTAIINALPKPNTHSKK